MSLTGILWGMALGFLHMWMFHRALENALLNSENSGARRLFLMLGMLRYFFTFVAGILIMRIAEVDPTEMGAGILLAIAISRAVRIKKFLKTEESQERC